MIRTVSSDYNWHSPRWKYPIPSLWTLCSKCHSHHQARICGRAVYLRSCFSMNEKLFPMHIPGILIGIMVPGILSWWKNTRYPVWLLWYRSNICLLGRLIGCLTRTWYQIARHDTQEKVEEAQEYWSPPQGLLQNRQRGLAYWLGVGTFGKTFSAFLCFIAFSVSVRVINARHARPFAWFETRPRTAFQLREYCSFSVPDQGGPGVAWRGSRHPGFAVGILRSCSLVSYVE